jgi:uncharacterized membrane protein YphA (DoxX/SURF4 family)
VTSYLVVTGRLLFAGIFVLSLPGKAPRRVAYRQFVTATADLLDVGGTTARILAAATVGAETAAVVLVLLPIFPVVGSGSSSLCSVATPSRWSARDGEPIEWPVTASARRACARTRRGR